MRAVGGVGSGDDGVGVVYVGVGEVLNEGMLVGWSVLALSDLGKKYVYTSERMLHSFIS